MRTTDPLLDLLRHRYGDQWHIRRTDHLWIATARDPNADHAPTIVEPEIEAFVRQLENPPARAGRSLLSARWCRARLDQLGDCGVYLAGEPPMT